MNGGLQQFARVLEDRMEQHKCARPPESASGETGMTETQPTPAEIAATLTEADDDGPCTDCEDTGWTFQTERPCTCEFGLAVRAHLENPHGR